MGLVSVFGNDVDNYYDKLLAGESGIGLIDRFDASKFPTRFAGQIRNFNSQGYIDGKNDRRLDDCLHYCLAAGKKALEDADLGGEKLNKIDKIKAGVHVGTGMGGLTVFSDGVKALIEKEPRKITPFFIPYAITNMGSALLAIDLGLIGPNYSISTACATWATILLQEHPEAFEKAKEESERIVKKRPPTQEGLSLKEIREMDYLSKVVDETLRWVSFSLMVFREALNDVNINGYTIPKGWKVLAWFRGVHLDPEIYPEPLEFNPSRWDGFTPKAGAFLPFGAGSRLCPGNDLAKLEISIFLHYFLLGYKLDRKNPSSPSMYLPHRRPKDNCVAKIVKV